MTALITTAIRSPDGSNADTARETITPVRTDTPAETAGSPEYNELDLDSSGQLTGLTGRQVPSDVRPTVKYSNSYPTFEPVDWTCIIDSQVSTSGTAAARELAGQFGHGTIMVTESLEPVIREGAELGGSYFQSNERDAGSLKGSYMTPVVADTDWNAVAQSVGVKNSRAAFNSTLYAGWNGQ